MPQRRSSLDLSLPDLSLPDLSLPDLSLPDLSLLDQLLLDRALPDQALLNRDSSARALVAAKMQSHLGAAPPDYSRDPLWYGLNCGRPARSPAMRESSSLV